MAEEPIRKEDIIDIKGTQESINELIAALEQLSTVMHKDLRESADALEKSLQGVNAATKEGQELIKQAATQSELLAAEQKELGRLDKERITLEARLSQSTSDLTQKNARLKVEIERQNKANKDQARLMDSADGSVNRMRQELKRLTDEYNRLDNAARQKVAPAINKLSAELKKAESAIGNNTRNVGNYRGALVMAGKELLAFSGLAGGATVILNQLKDAFLETEQGANAMSRVKAGVKAFFTSVVQGNLRDAGSNAAAAFLIAKETNAIKKDDRRDLVEIARMESEIAILRFKSADATRSTAEQMQWLIKAQEKEDELIAFKTADAEEELANVRLALAFTKDNLVLLERESQILAEIEGFKGEKSLRFETRRTALLEKQQKESEAKLKAEQDAFEKLKDDNAKLYDVAVDFRAKDLTDYDDSLRHKLTANEEFYDQQEEMAKRHRAVEQKLDEETEQRKQDLIDESFSFISGSLNTLGNLYQTQKENELSAAGDNATKREEIERKFAKKQQNIAVGQALINGAMAITEIWRKWGANPIIAGIFTALSAAQTIAQVAIIKSQKFARGGSGILNGPTHASGGVNIGIGEAEGGEHVSVTSRAMTSRYGGRMLDAVANSINQGKFFEVWGNLNRESDPYTKKMYELMRNTPSIYIDTNGDTVHKYPDGRTNVIKRFNRN